MNRVILITSVLDNIIKLLESNNENNWVHAFKIFRKKCDNSNAEDLKLLYGEIRRIYGGMNSFNDVILCHQGEYLVKENETLDGFRKELFDILNDR